MGQEQIKVLEMVASGKITPQDGERLINALNGNGNSSNRGRTSSGFGIPEIQIPNIDLGRLVEMALAIKKTVVETARNASGKIKRSKASKYFEAKDYPVSVDLSGDPAGQVSLDLHVQAGQLKVLGEMDEAGKLLVGQATCVPDAPSIVSDIQDGVQSVVFRHSLGSCWLRLADTPDYSIKLENAAADTRLDLTALKAGSVKVNNNAGNLDLRLGERAAQVELEITNNAGSVDLTVDGGFALKIHTSGSLSSSNIENLGLTLADGSYLSPDWNENARRVEILLAQNVASFSLSWRGAKKAPKMISATINVTTRSGSGVDSSAAADAEAGLSEADKLADEANAAVREVQAAIDDLAKSKPSSPAPSAGATAGADAAAPKPAPKHPDLPSSDL